MHTHTHARARTQQNAATQSVLQTLFYTMLPGIDRIILHFLAMFVTDMWPSSSLLVMVVVVVVTMAVGVGGQIGTNSNVTQAQEFLDKYNTEAQTVFSANAEVSWIYNTNITAENQQNVVRT